MKDKILQLCRRLKKCSLEDLMQISELDKNHLENILLYFEQLGKIEYKNGSVMYIEKMLNVANYGRNLQDMFLSIKEQITPFRTHAVPSKPVRCVETGVIFKNARKAAKWLYDIEATSSVSADAAVKLACKGKRSIANGYHWEFVKES